MMRVIVQQVLTPFPDARVPRHVQGPATWRPRAVVQISEELRAGDLGLRLRGERHLAQAREEKSLVDPTVEDRDAQLATLGDDIAPVQPGFTRQLGGRQVIGHRSSPFWRSLHAHKYAASSGRSQWRWTKIRLLDPRISPAFEVVYEVLLSGSIQISVRTTID
jgi:hypothetical protein